MVVQRHPARLVLMFLVGCGLGDLYLKRMALISNLISIFEAPILRSKFVKGDGVRAIQEIWNKRGRVLQKPSQYAKQANTDAQSLSRRVSKVM